MDNLPNEAINKVADAAIKFLGLILKPGAKSIGLLIDDKIRSWRVQNQVNILIKAQKFVESKGINIRAIPLKILVPLLENGSLEEDDDLQDLWAKMLANMLDSKENFQNHVFPYILSQLSKDDFEELQKVAHLENEYWANCRFIEEVNSGKIPAPSGVDLVGIDAETKDIEQLGFDVLSPIDDNLVRLGLLRETPPSVIIPPFNNEHGSIELTAEYEAYSYGHRITELGTMFLSVCE